MDDIDRALAAALEVYMEPDDPPYDRRQARPVIGGAVVAFLRSIGNSPRWPHLDPVSPDEQDGADMFDATKLADEIERRLADGEAEDRGCTESLRGPGRRTRKSGGDRSQNADAP